MNIKKLFTTNFYKNNNREYKERIKKDFKKKTIICP